MPGPAEDSPTTLGQVEANPTLTLEEDSPTTPGPVETSLTPTPAEARVATPGLRATNPAETKVTLGPAATTRARPEAGEAEAASKQQTVRS